MLQTWEMIPKSQSDNTLIEQAIGDAIADHNDDVAAHLGPNQAMQSHRAAEIIDHVAESVVNDKIRANARSYIAIVDQTGGGDFTTIEDACDFATARGGGSVYIKAGNYSPTRTLKLKYGVDLFGEGPNETHIDMTSAGFTGLNVTGDAIITTLKIAELYAYLDSDDMDVVLPGGLSAELLHGMYVVLPWGDGNLYEIQSTFAIEFDYVADDDYYLTDVEVMPTVTASTTSDIVHVNGWGLTTGLDGGEGLEVWSNSTYLGDFLEYLGNGDVKLTANALATVDRETGINYKARGGRMSIIQGISMDCNGAEYFLNVDGNRGRLFIRDADFQNVAGFFKMDPYTTTLEGLGVVIEDTNITMATGYVSIETPGAVIRNTDIACAASTGCDVLGGIDAYYENVRFKGKLLATTNYMTLVRDGSRFNGCVFKNFAAGNVVNNGTFSGASPDVYVLFTGCEFTNSSAANILFNGHNINVSSCRIYASSSGNTGFTSTSKYCLMAACQGRAGSATVPATCIMSGNNLVVSMS